MNFSRVNFPKLILRIEIPFTETPELKEKIAQITNPTIACFILSNVVDSTLRQLTCKFVKASKVHNEFTNLEDKVLTIETEPYTKTEIKIWHNKVVIVPNTGNDLGTILSRIDEVNKHYAGSPKQEIVLANYKKLLTIDPKDVDAIFFDRIISKETHNRIVYMAQQNKNILTYKMT